ncbi:DUF6221 family protein [Spirillospora sp. CA-294931]|uniref:DUF6221 family protein n=1 Tax=Spirillospora sp. CA-294931 TaxID=3240042 RepID=UPI003D89B15D
MTVTGKFLDRQLAEDARYGGRMDLDELPSLPGALDRHLRSCARFSAGRLRVNQEIRARFAQRAGVVRLLAYAYAGMPGYRDSWRPALTDGPVSVGSADFLLARWRDEERLARQAAEEVGLDFSWREVERQDGHGLVIDGAGRPLWDVAVYPEDGYIVSRHGPGRVLRELAARREMLAGLDLRAEADRTLLRLLAGTGALGGGCEGDVG